MNDEEFESWFVPSPRRLHTLDPLPINIWLKTSIVCGLLAIVFFIAWQAWK